MNVLLHGATGMIGQGVLRECLVDDRVKRVIAVVRAPLSFTHPKLRALTHRDFTDFSSLAGEFEAVDACFFSLGISSAGKSEDEYCRPGYIQPLYGVTSKTPAYRWLYVGVSWLYPLLRRLVPKHVTTTENLGRAMLTVAGRGGAGERILYSPDINRAAAEGR